MTTPDASLYAFKIQTIDTRSHPSSERESQLGNPQYLLSSSRPLPPRGLDDDDHNTNSLNTVKAESFSEVTRIFVQPDGRHADVFADGHGVKRTLHAYGEKPFRVRGKEIIVFRKYTKLNKVSGMDTDTVLRLGIQV